MRWPDRRPWAVEPGSAARFTPGYRLFGALGALGIVAACAWCLRDLSTPTVGFDARALWLNRAGWLLHSHQQLLTTLRAPTLILGQSAYPPLVSASTAVSWSVTGNHTLRLGVVVTAALEHLCAGGGRLRAGRVRTTGGRPPRRHRRAGRGRRSRWWWEWLPRCCWSSLPSAPPSRS